MKTISKHSFKKSIDAIYTVILAVLLFVMVWMATGSQSFAALFAMGILFLGFVAGVKLPTGIAGSFARIGRYSQRFESFESLAQSAGMGTLTARQLATTVASNPDIIKQLPANTQAHIGNADFVSAANSLSAAMGAGTPGNPLGATQQVNGGPAQNMGGPWNNTISTKATFQLNISAPYVTTDTTTTDPPVTGTYNLPIFGVKASKANYMLPGIAAGPAGYTMQVYNGALIAQTTGVLPAPWANVPVNPFAWYIAYTSLATGQTAGAMWAITNNQSKMPYTMFLDGIFETYFAIARMRYILNNVSQIQQYSYTFEKLNFESFGSGGYDTIDTNIYNSPEQFKSNNTDVDINCNIGPSDLFIVGTDPTIVTAGWTFGVFASHISRRAQANQGAA